MSLLPEIETFLLCPTPDAWLNWAVENQEILLIDHANCEKKAASTALALLFRHVEKTDLQHKLSRLAREELRHFEQVLALMQKRGMAYRPLSASHYAERLHRHIRRTEPQRLTDTLIAAAFIEARSCERFYRLAPLLDDELAYFYRSLLKSEARHYQDYLKLAEQHSKEPIDERVQLFAQIERDAILIQDSEFRFHSGVPF